MINSSKLLFVIIKKAAFWGSLLFSNKIELVVNCATWATTFTSTAINASIFFNLINITGNNSIYGTFIFTCTTSRANFRVNFKSHLFLF